MCYPRSHDNFVQVMFQSSWQIYWVWWTGFPQSGKIFNQRLVSRHFIYIFSFEKPLIYQAHVPLYIQNLMHMCDTNRDCIATIKWSGRTKKTQIYITCVWDNKFICSYLCKKEIMKLLVEVSSWWMVASSITAKHNSMGFNSHMKLSCLLQFLQSLIHFS